MTEELQTNELEPTSVLAVIERAARDEHIDVEKMKALFDLQERIMLRRAEMSFNVAMSKAHDGMKPIQADATHPQTRSKYATYKALDKVLRPIYVANGFALSFNTSGDAPTEHIRVLCDVSHREGFTKQYQVDMPNDGKGAKGGDVMTKTHATGAGLSYGMRYLLKMIFNVAVGEDDQDGNEVAPAITEKEAADLRALVEEVGADEKKFCQYMRVEKISDIAARDYE